FGKMARQSIVDLHSRDLVFDGTQSQRRVGNSHCGDARALQIGGTAADGDSDAGEREVAEAARHFLEGPAMLLRDRKLNFYDDLILLEAIGQGIDKKA